jgi:hypothetical protein
MHNACVSLAGKATTDVNVVTRQLQPYVLEHTFFFFNSLSDAQLSYSCTVAHRRISGTL